MTAPGHVDFYAIVLFVHIVAAIAAFGAMFAYPVIDAVVRRRDPRAMATYHEAQIQIARKVVTPGATLVLIAGVYLVADRWGDASSGWWSAALAIVVVLLGLEHAILIPNGRRLRDRAALDAQGGETAGFSDDYERMARSQRIVGTVTALLVVVAVFLMVVKPGV